MSIEKLIELLQKLSRDFEIDRVIFNEIIIISTGEK